MEAQMQTRNPFIDDFSKMFSGAAGAAQAASSLNTPCAIASAIRAEPVSVVMSDSAPIRHWPPTCCMPKVRVRGVVPLPWVTGV